jgi:hypothetical protein
MREKIVTIKRENPPIEICPRITHRTIANGTHSPASACGNDMVRRSLAQASDHFRLTFAFFHYLQLLSQFHHAAVG